MGYPTEPPHPAVAWTTARLMKGRTRVETTCPICSRPRWDDAGQVRYRIRKGTYSGRCYKDRLLNKARVDRLARPAHPAVDWGDTALVTTGRRRYTRVAVTCPKCAEKRWMQTGATAAKVRDGSFTGECLGCSKNARKREWVVLSPGRKLDPNKGYIRLGAEGVEPADRALYAAMLGRQSFVMEHRLVMARSLGRPLLPNELVDHQDGIKTNNDIGNLRLYRRGRNEPGETSGYGTFYHEWQMALTRIRELEALLA